MVVKIGRVSEVGLIELKEVSYRYPNDFLAVDQVSLSIQEGENVAIIGQNGAGKTTTVKLMNGLLKPVTGNVYVQEWDTQEHTTAQISRHVGYVFQNPDDQIFHNNVYDEVAFSARYMKLDEEEVDRRVQDAAKLTGIENLLDENPYNLPLSIRKFVTIAAVLVMDSECIILDEPTAGQDLAGVNLLANLIRELQSRGKAIVTITHDMEFVVDNFERIIVMANKHVIFDGSVRDAFWDFKVLEESYLQQPFIAQLAKEFDLDNNVLSSEEFEKVIFNLKENGNKQSA